jgi:steroid 5-alpha reductase family enzyme
MELQDMQKQWKAMNSRLETMEIIQKNQIMEMTRKEYKSQFKKLWNIEFIGALICYAMAGWIVFDFQKFNTPFHMACALLTLLFLAILPILVLRYISNIKNISLSETSYKETIKKFQKNKNRLLATQQFSGVAGILIFFLSMPVFSKLFGNDNSFESLKMSQYIFIALTFIAVLLLILWSIKKYKGIMTNAEKLLRELDE